MAEAAAAPKKKGKLPLILVVALVVGGGGFFVMKPKPKESHAIEASKEVLSIGELTVNLKESGIYLKCTPVLVPRKDYKKELLDHSMEAIKDYIVCKIPDFSITQVKTFEGKRAIQKALVEGINNLLPEDKDMVNPAEPKKKKGDQEEDTAEAHEFDAPKGPVLRVYFTAFAWQ